MPVVIAGIFFVILARSENLCRAVKIFSEIGSSRADREKILHKSGNQKLTNILLNRSIFDFQY